MAFHLKRGEGVAKGFRRIALEQNQAALTAAADPNAREAAPHAIRKQCKKLRGLLRLVRGSFRDYHLEQRALRDASRKLASVRDAAVHLEVLERLCLRDPARHHDPDFECARSWLQARHHEAVRASREHDCVDQVHAMLREQRERIAHWTLQAHGFDALEAGLIGTYRTARRALAAAQDQPTARHLHELRKHVKYHRYHIDLLHKQWPRSLLAVVHEAEELGEVLGEHHDIDVLLATLGHGDAAPELADAAKRIAVCVQPELVRLEHAALCTAQRLLTEKPRCFGKRMRGYWNASRG